ncbi:MAG TPA: PepSY-like domain-containing protein [Chitinophagaceae bacterium]|nr:PepSY-like domain-containing protein [Chitinophagaceae bacterium]
MRFNKWLIIAICAAFTSSCGENSTKETTVETDTAGAAITSESSNQGYETSKSVEVPPATRTSFETKYPNATNVTWRKYEPVSRIEWDWADWPVLDTGDYMVNYTWDGSEYWTWYDEDNNWIGTVSTVTDYAGLPAAVNKTIQSEFAGYTVSAVDKENDKNRTAYEIDLTKGDEQMRVLIDENGKVWKKKNLTTGEKTKSNPKDM